MSQQVAATRSTSMLNESGDLTFVWTEDDDDKVIPVIQKKMEQGVVFFVVEPRGFGFLPPRKTTLHKASDATKKRAISVSDEDFSALLNAGTGDLAKPAGPVKTVRRAKTAKEAGTAHTVGVQQAKGG